MNINKYIQFDLDGNQMGIVALSENQMLADQFSYYVLATENLDLNINYRFDLETKQIKNKDSEANIAYQQLLLQARKNEMIELLENKYIEKQVFFIKNGKTFILPLTNQVGDYWQAFQNIVFRSQISSLATIDMKALEDNKLYTAKIPAILYNQILTPAGEISGEQHKIKEKLLVIINDATSIEELENINFDNVFYSVEARTYNINSACEDLYQNSTNQKLLDFLASKRSVVDNLINYNLFTAVCQD